VVRIKSFLQAATPAYVEQDKNQEQTEYVRTVRATHTKIPPLMLLVVHVWHIQPRLQAAPARAPACAPQVVQKQGGSVCCVRAAHTKQGFLMMHVVRVQAIRILQKVVQQVQRVSVTQGIVEKMVVLALYVHLGNTKVRVHFVLIVLHTHILQRAQML